MYTEIHHRKGRELESQPYIPGQIRATGVSTAIYIAQMPDTDMGKDARSNDGTDTQASAGHHAIRRSVHGTLEAMDARTQFRRQINQYKVQARPDGGVYASYAQFWIRFIARVIHAQR